MDLNGSLREKLTWKVMYKCTMQALMSRNIRFWWYNQHIWFHKKCGQTMCLQKVSESGVVFLIFYVDDLLLLTNNISLL